MECAYGLPSQKYEISRHNSQAGTISGTHLSLSLFLDRTTTKSSFPEKTLQCLEDIRSKSVTLVHERNKLLKDQETEAKEKKQKEVEEKAKKQEKQKGVEEKAKKQEKDKDLKLQMKCTLYNIDREADEATMTKDELEQHRLDKFFGLAQKMLAKMREWHMESVYKEWDKVNIEAFKKSES